MSEVYFAESQGRIKIGYSKNVAARVRNLNSGNPGAITVIATMPGGRPLESRLHAELAAFRLQGEWFNDCAEVRSAIQKYSTIAAGEATVTANLEAAIKCHPVELVTECNLTDVSSRFSRLINLNILDRLSEARTTEKHLDLPKGELMDKIMPAAQRKQVGEATDLLIYAHTKYGKVLDKFQMVFLDDDVDQTPYFTAIEQLVSAAEKAFEPFLTGRPISEIRNERKGEGK